MSGPQGAGATGEPAHVGLRPELRLCTFQYLKGFSACFHMQYGITVSDRKHTKVVLIKMLFLEMQHVDKSMPRLMIMSIKHGKLTV